MGTLGTSSPLSELNPTLAAMPPAHAAELCLDSLTSAQQRALERDLILASQVQRALLPKTDVRHGGWQIHYQYKSKGIVSGDYCDVIPSACKSAGLIFLIGDVSGKGVAASLLMTHLHATFRSLASVGLELDQLIAIANRLFCESTSASLYATLACGRISGQANSKSRALAISRLFTSQGTA